MTTTSGDIVAGTLTTGTSIGAAAGGTAGPGDIILTSAGGATLNGTANAQRNLAVTARNRITVNSLATGQAVDLRSADIAIATSANAATGRTGTIGEQGRTTSVLLTNTDNSVTTIGGAGTTSGYSLSNAEAQRIFAGDIIIVAPRVSTSSSSGQVSAALNTRAPDVVLDTLTLTGSSGRTGATAGNIGNAGRLRIETAGKLRTVGEVVLSNLTSGNRFQIAASEAIEVDAATGSISLKDATTGRAGTLDLASADVIAASLPTIASVASLTGTKAISDLLGVNGGAVRDEGYLSADGIIVTVSGSFFVQNSGAASTNLRNFADRRGLTVGAGGLSINTGTSPSRIAINGRQVSASAATGFATGIDFLKLVNINGVNQVQGSVTSFGGLDLDSTINGCAIRNFNACQINFDNGNIAREVINGVTDQDLTTAGGDGTLPFTLLTLKDVEPLPFQPLIDDPVTGSGNDDLWAVDDGDKCPEGETCAK